MMTAREAVARAQALLTRKPEKCYGNISYPTLEKRTCPKCKSGPTEPCGRIGEHVGNLEDVMGELIRIISRTSPVDARGGVATAICSQSGSACHGDPCNDSVCETALKLHGADADAAIAAHLKALAAEGYLVVKQDSAAKEIADGARPNKGRFNLEVDNG